MFAKAKAHGIISLDMVERAILCTGYRQGKGKQIQKTASWYNIMKGSREDDIL